ncbi:MAG: hypothetical protein QW728_02870 [Thermoplasmata archaeon]
MALKEQIQEILAEYMGPIAPRFFQRQCTHINKTPDELTLMDLDELARWCHISSKLTLGEATAAEIREKILALKQKKPSGFIKKPN